MTVWHEDNTFWETMAPVLFAERRWAVAQTEIDQAMTHLGLSPGAHLLDLCCGVGRHTLELARRGFQMTGVDKTSIYLDRARKQADIEGLQVEFVQEDMRNFYRPETFDGAINLFTSFGYFEDPREDRQVVMNLYRSLKPGGTLVMEMMGKEVLARVFRDRDWHEEDGIIFMEERKISKNWSWVESRWIMLKGNQRAEFTISLRLYSAAELTSLLRECGFNSVEIYGDLAGASYDQTARRLVAVGHKE